jgi:hypothetical protein
MRFRPLLLVLAAGVTVAGCGTRPGDLFDLSRSGAIPGANLRLVVRDDGIARCNGGPRHRLPDQRLLEAREVVRELEPAAHRRLALPAGPNSVLRYRLRLEQGSVSFADDSPRQTKGTFLAQQFARNVARDVCGLPR